MKTSTSQHPPTISIPHSSALAALIMAALLTAGSAFAASQTWTNAPTDSTWTNINNWNGRAVPGGLNMTGNSVNNDVVTFNSPIPGSGIGGAANPVLTDDATIVNDRSRQIGSITFDTANCGAYVISNTSPAATATASTPETGILNVSHNGTIQLTASVTNSQWIMVPLFTRLPSSTAGIYNLVNNSTNAATLFINSITNDSATSRGTDFRLGGSNTGTNTVGSISAGTTTTGANALTKQGNGTWILAGANDFRAQTVVSITAGKLIVRDPTAFIGSTNVTVTNTGILQLDGVTLTQPSLNLNKGGEIRMNGTASVNGVAVGAQPGTSGTLSTVNASDVFTVGTGLTISALVTGGTADTVLDTTGPGTLVFGQGNTYVGRWNFAAATNQISNFSALGTGANANIAAGAILDLTPLGATTFMPTTSGLGGSGTGTTVGATAAELVADPATTIDLSGKTVDLTFTPVSATGDTTHPALYVAQGTLTLSGNTFFVNNASGSPLGVGTYRLIQQATGSVTSGGGYAALVTGSGVAAGTIADIQVSGGNVDMVVIAYTAKNLVWTGGNPDSTWDTSTTSNFLADATASVFHVSDNVSFNAIGSTNPTVNLFGTLLPTSLAVDTSANDYTFTGSGRIGGTTSLLKLSTGVLLLQTANSYAGGTVVSNGTVRFGVENAVPDIGSGDVAIYDGGSLDLNNFNGTINGLNGDGTVDNQGGSASVLTVGNNDRPGSFSGVLQNASGTLALTKIGTNTQILAASNTYSGPTTLSGGTLAVVNAHALGAGDLSTSAGSLDVRTPVLYLNSLTGTGGSIANNNTATTNRVVITGTTTTTFGGAISDGSGGGGMALTLLGGSLTMSGVNTYTGGTILGSGTSFFIPNGPAAVTGGVIASNGVTIGLSGGSTTPPATPTSITTVDGATIILSGGAEGKIFQGQFIGGATATNRFIANSTGVSAGGTLSFSNFLGVVQIATTNTSGAAANFRFFNDGGVSGGDNTMFQLLMGNIHVRGSTTAAQTVYMGALLGGDSGSGIGGPGTAAALPTVWIIGGRNMDMEFQGYINGSNSIVKSGTGTLTLDSLGVTTNTDSATYTNYVYAPLVTYLGTTTISNGVLALICPNDLSNSPSITLAAPTAVLDASQMGYISNYTDVNGDNSFLITNSLLHVYTGQTLAGVGTVRGALLADAGATLAPGLPVGVLTVTNSVTNNGAFNIQLDRAGTPNSGRLVAPAIDVTDATITVTNVGADLVTGDVFQLFSQAVTGTPMAVNLPVQNQAATVTYVWTNMLAIDGSIKVLSGASPVDQNPTNLTFSVSGNQITLSWPAGHTGWDLQTNAVSVTDANSWFTYPGSAGTNQVILTIDPARTNVYYRMHLAQ